MTASTGPAAAGAAPAPKQKGVIRLGNVIFFTLSILGFTFFGAGRLTKSLIEKHGTKALGAEVRVDRADLKVFSMTLALRGLHVADPADKAKDQFSAEEVSAKLEPLALLRGQLVVEEARLSKPRGRITRRTDGTIGAPPEPPPGTPPGDSTWRKRLEEEARKRDLVEDVKRLLEKAKEKRAEWAKKKEEAKKEREEAARKGTLTKEEIAEGRAEWVRDSRPLIIVRRLVADGLEITLEDQASQAPAQTVNEATLEVKEWSNAPSLHDKPMEVRLDGKLAGAAGSAVKVQGLLDMRGEEKESSLDVHLANVPLPPLDALYRQAIPVSFQGGSTGTLDLPLKFQGWNIDWRPAMLLDKIDARPRDPNQQIAGFPASKVAQELTNAGRLMLQDIRIHGPIWAPKVEGDVETVKQLVIQGGKAYALKQAQKYAEKGKEIAAEQAQKVFEKNPELKKKLDETGAGAAIEKGAGAIGDAIGIPGLGGGSKPAEKPAPAPAPGDKKAPDKGALGGAKDAADGALDMFGRKKK